MIHLKALTRKIVVLIALFAGVFLSVSESGAAQNTAVHSGQDLADAFQPKYTLALAFLGSDKVEFTLLMEMLGVETHAGQDMAAAFSMARKKSITG